MLLNEACFEKKQVGGEKVKPVARRWAQHVAKNIPAVEAKEEGEATRINETSAGGPVVITQSDTEDSRPPQENDVELWPGSRKRQKNQVLGEALSSKEDTSNDDIVPYQSNEEPPQPPVRRSKVTDRYLTNVIPRVDSAVSDLVKEHASRTPVGKSRSKRIDSPAETVPDTVSMPAADGEDSDEEDFHQIVTVNNLEDLEDDTRVEITRLGHSEPVVPKKIDENVSELVKKHSSRTPVGKTRNKLTGRWNSVKKSRCRRRSRSHSCLRVPNRTIRRSGVARGQSSTP